MGTFLKEIQGGSAYNRTQTEIYNHKFFNRHVDLNKLKTLLSISGNYSKIIDLLNKRPEDDEALRELNEKLEKLAEEVRLAKNSQVDLYNNKLDIDELRKEIYQASEIDFEKIKNLTTLESHIDNSLSKNNAILEESIAEQRTKTNEKEKIIDNREKLDFNIEEKISKLNDSFSELKEENLDIFNNTDIDSLREGYEKGLTDIIQNSSGREAYTNYLFDSLKRENKVLIDTFTTAKKFTESAKKETGFEVSDLDVMNTKIKLNEEIAEHVNYDMGQFANVWCLDRDDEDKSITGIGNDFVKLKPFIDSIYDHIEILPANNINPSEFESNHDKLYDQYRKLDGNLAELQAKDYNKLINKRFRIFKKDAYYTSTETVAYEFSVSVYKDIKSDLDKLKTQTLEKNQKNKTGDEQINNKLSQSHNIKPLQEPTEEQNIDLINDAIESAFDISNSGIKKR